MKAVIFAAALAGTLAGAAYAQQEGLVNLNVSDNQVSVPIGIAAQACGVSVDALQVDTTTNTVTECELDQENQALQSYINNSNRQTAPGQQEGGGNANAPGQQEGGGKANAPGQQSGGG